MAGGIFVSYRRDDAKHAAGRLVDRLEKSFSRDQLFFDIDTIEPGVDFVRVLKEQVERCDVLLAIIGPGWLDARDEHGARRLDNPKDFVRIELETALARDIRVIPVLVDGARMPGEGELPPMLAALASRQAVRLMHERFASDAESLTHSITSILGSKLSQQGSPTSAPNVDRRSQQQPSEALRSSANLAHPSCPMCSGGGLINLGAGRTAACPSCLGTGVDTSRTKRRVCPMCSGQGVINLGAARTMACPSCQGTCVDVTYESDIPDI